MRYQHEKVTYYMHYPRRHYGVLNFVGDLFMVGLTGGLWLIWIFVREMRGR
jgi:hypothetical protein